MSFEMMPKKEESFLPKSELTIHDVSYPELEEIKKNNPDLYHKMLEDELGNLEKEQENFKPEPIIDSSTLDQLYEKEQNDIYHHT